MPDHFVAFWNVENLFDVEGALDRPVWLARNLKQELAGWNEPVLAHKIAQLSRVIMGMNAGQGPDLLGVCEVENRAVLVKLTTALAALGRSYEIAHADTADQRGIDVAFLYDPLRYEEREQFHHVILKRTATRDLFQVNFAVRASGRELIVIGNHWPARSEGQLESEPFRIIAGETLAYWHQRIREIKGKDAAIIVMGDFNDEPFDRSVRDYALGSYDREKVMRSDTPRLFNLMWPLMGKRRGSHYFDNFACVLDQFMVSRGLLQAGAPFAVLEDTVAIEQPAGMVTKGAYPGPVRYGRPSGGLNQDGFSDHFPISMIVREA